MSTLGKTIKSGWEWLGITPATPERIGGCIEVPALAECLTLNKADFIRSGPRGAISLAFRKAIQEAVSRQLEAWGDSRDAADAAKRRIARPLEKDLEHVLMELVGDFPMLASLVETRPGGQRKLSLARTATPVAIVEDGGLAGLSAGAETQQLPEAGDESLAQAMPEVPPGEPPREEPRPPGEPPPVVPEAGAAPGGGGGRSPRRSGHYGLEVQFIRWPNDPELGKLIESTVWVNEAHPAYQRAAASRSEGYHIALSVALSPLAAPPAGEHEFVTSFLSRWGSALAPKPRGGGLRRKAQR